MQIAFSEVCALLERLEDQETRDPPLLPSDKASRSRQTIETWFRSHRSHIDSLNADRTVSLLSTLLPERRIDRVYQVKEPGLCRMLCRSLGLGTTRRADLEAYRVPGKGDLGACLARVLQDEAHGSRMLHRANRPITVDDVDKSLHEWASQCRFSDLSVLADSSHKSANKKHTVLRDVLLLLTASQAKWLVRLILKDLSPVSIDESLVLGSFHFMLPDLLRVQNNLLTACTLLRGALDCIPPNPDLRSRAGWLNRAAPALVPVLGTKIGRPNFLKARSITHCMQMLAQRTWVLERKYDGEFCEIHIDKTKKTSATNFIQIFSKSGKDSTLDRRSIHSTLVECLHLDQPDCVIKYRAILLGEMVVFSTRGLNPDVLPFEKLRKHIPRSGSLIGTRHDSPIHEEEQPGIVFFDLLLHDDEVVMSLPVDKRRKRLREVYQKIPGRAMSAEWKVIDFGRPESREKLIHQFAAAIANRCEGLILKPVDAPYISIGTDYKSPMKSYIKLKKDYINGLGDDADLAVVGASYSAHHAVSGRGAGKIQWTDFHLACLINKDDVRRYGLKPSFRQVAVVHDKTCIPAACLVALNQRARFMARPYSAGSPPYEFDLTHSTPEPMMVYFTDPIVVEILGSGYVRPQNCNFLMLRHPRMVKVHEDRSWKDVDSFLELQAKGREAREAPVDALRDEHRQWVDKLVRKCKRKRDHSESNKNNTLERAPPDRSSEGRPQGLVPVHIDVSQPRGRHVLHVLHDAQRISPSGSKCLPNRLPMTEQALDSTPMKRRRMLVELDINSTLHSSVNEDVLPTSPRESSPLTGLLVYNELDANGQERNPKSCSPQTETLSVPRSSAALTSPPRDIVPCPVCCSVIYLVPCIAKTAWITEDLLSAHDCVVVTDLKFWDRDSFAHAKGTAVVSESQAYEGSRKIVLVESNRPAKVKETMRSILALNGHRWRERVEVYDWRILTHCHTHLVPRAALSEWRINAMGIHEHGE